jgi:hypothetical protein
MEQFLQEYKIVLEESNMYVKIIMFRSSGSTSLEGDNHGSN